jgi:proteasome alpha subunit
MGGSAEAIGTALREGHRDDIPLDEGLRLAVASLAAADTESRTISAAQLEVAVLDRTRPRRTFRRLTDAQLEALLATK